MTDTDPKTETPPTPDEWLRSTARRPHAATDAQRLFGTNPDPEETDQ